MNEERDLLATLRDIGEPPPPEGSPPLLLLANAALALLLLALVARRLRRRRRAWLDESLGAVRAARSRPPAAARLSLATLLRRLMRHRHGDTVDALRGEAWLARLDAEFGGDWFSRGAGRAFGDALYADDGAAGEGADDVDALCDALAAKLKRLPRTPRSGPPPGGTTPPERA